MKEVLLEVLEMKNWGSERWCHLAGHKAQKRQRQDLSTSPSDHKAAAYAHDHIASGFHVLCWVMSFLSPPEPPFSSKEGRFHE